MFLQKSGIGLKDLKVRVTDDYFKQVIINATTREKYTMNVNLPLFQYVGNLENDNWQLIDIDFYYLINYIYHFGVFKKPDNIVVKYNGKIVVQVYLQNLTSDNTLIIKYDYIMSCLKPDPIPYYYYLLLIPFMYGLYKVLR